jgi:hypothetical protein
MYFNLYGCKVYILLINSNSNLNSPAHPLAHAHAQRFSAVLLAIVFFKYFLLAAHAQTLFCSVNRG